MNKINVNMTPNPLDLQTLHCSQGDTEERKFQFTLHNQGETYDLSNISDPVFTSFPVEVGGTEELLPTNTSTPTTSPALADIQYPDGLREDESFTYRESPTTVDGKAKVKVLKGNTLVWNQLVQNGNFADNTRWNVRNSATINSIANNILTFTASAQGSGVTNLVSLTQNSYYIYAFEYISNEPILFNIAGQSTTTYASSTSWSRATSRIKWNATTSSWELRILSNATENFSAIQVRNVMLINLTLMFGAGNEPTTVDEFTALFPLPYYEYDAGSLLSFNGTGIKTTNADETEETTTSLPISTYFPTGMKSAGSVYDELTPSKAITRVGSVDLGSLTWTLGGSGNFYDTPVIEGLVANSINIKSSRYTTGYSSDFENNSSLIGFSISASKKIRFYNSGLSSASEVASALSGVYLNYELTTPSEVSIMSASLITENGEAILYHSGDVLECECNEDISSEPGFHVAKIKFTYDDGTNYSNKIELHVERSPQ